MQEKRDYKFVLPDGSEHFEEAVWNAACANNSSAVYDAIGRAVRKSGVKTTRKNPQPLCVKIYRLEIVDGKVKAHYNGTFNVTPPFIQLTEEEYNSELTELLKPLPSEFRSFVSSTAWNDGHSSGYEEVLSIAGSLVSDLKPAIDLFREKMIKDLQ